MGTSKKGQRRVALLTGDGREDGDERLGVVVLVTLVMFRAPGGDDEVRLEMAKTMERSETIFASGNDGRRAMVWRRLW